jgi:hypothetical protein
MNDRVEAVPCTGCGCEVAVSYIEGKRQTSHCPLCGTELPKNLTLAERILEMVVDRKRQRLMPWPEADQETAFAGFWIDGLLDRVERVHTASSTILRVIERHEQWWDDPANSPGSDEFAASGALTVLADVRADLGLPKRGPVAPNTRTAYWEAEYQRKFGEFNSEQPGV